MEYPIYKAVINPDLMSDVEVNYIALVDKPAIEKNFLAFNKFVEPNTKESKDAFIPRCISYIIDEGKDQEQAIAICNTMWEQHFASDSYSDYPQSAKDDAARGIKLNEKINNKCATQVGKVRAQQIANGESLSKETIKRTFSYLSRASEYYNPKDTESCGTISYLLWGGESMLRYCESKINKDDFAVFEKISFDYDNTLITSKGKELAQKELDKGNDVYIISARNSKDELLTTAKELKIPSKNVYATGSINGKVSKIKELDIAKHYDDNADVIKMLPNGIGQKFISNAMRFAINEEKKIISGAAMIADMPIYRKDDVLGEYYVIFDAASIQCIVEKFSAKGFMNNFNLFHEETEAVSDVTIFNSFISNTELGINPPEGFEDCANGSWFISAKVNNDAVWQRVKTGELRGFSVEGIFNYIPIQSTTSKKYSPEQAQSLIEAILSETDFND